MRAGFIGGPAATHRAGSLGGPTRHGSLRPPRGVAPHADGRPSRPVPARVARGRRLRHEPQRPRPARGAREGPGREAPRRPRRTARGPRPAAPAVGRPDRGGIRVTGRGTPRSRPGPRDRPDQSRGVVAPAARHHPPRRDLGRRARLRPYAAGTAGRRAAARRRTRPRARRPAGPRARLAGLGARHDPTRSPVVRGTHALPRLPAPVRRAATVQAAGRPADRRRPAAMGGPDRLGARLVVRLRPRQRSRPVRRGPGVRARGQRRRPGRGTQGGSIRRTPAVRRLDQAAARPDGPTPSGRCCRSAERRAAAGRATPCSPAPAVPYRRAPPPTRAAARTGSGCRSAR